MTTSDSEAFESADEEFLESTPKKTLSKANLKSKSKDTAVVSSVMSTSVPKNDSLSQSEDSRENEQEESEMKKDSVVTEPTISAKNIEIPEKKKKERPKRQPVERKPKQTMKLGVKVNEEQITNVPAEIAKDIPQEKAPMDDDDNWNDFDVEDDNTDDATIQPTPQPKEIKFKAPEVTQSREDDGWGDNFDDWGDDDDEPGIVPTKKTQEESASVEPSEREYTAIADRLSSLGDAGGEAKGGWGGWGGWGASLLTSGVSQLTSHVSQGFTTVSSVIESGMGAPDPEELVRLQKASREKRESEAELVKQKSEIPNKTDGAGDMKEQDGKNIQDELSPSAEGREGAEDTTGVFKFGKLVSSVTKLVETTGTAVVTGGLDTLEEIGKRTMRVLQGEEEGQRVRLSTLLREARDRDLPPSSLPGEQATKKRPPRFEALFDDYQGLVHLEALEMLSKQCDMKIQSLLMNAQGKELTELRETLNQVKDICELPDVDEEDEDNMSTSEEKHNPETFRNKLVEATKDMEIQLIFNPIVKCWEDTLKETSAEVSPEADSPETSPSAETIAQSAVASLAQSSALSVQLLQRATALLAIRERRSTADEADGLTQLTVVLSSHIGEVAALYSQKLNQMADTPENSESTNEFITNVFLESGKGSSYIQDAFLLTIPILQVGAT